MYLGLLARIGSEIFAAYSHRPNIRPSVGGGRWAIFNIVQIYYMHERNNNNTTTNNQ